MKRFWDKVYKSSKCWEWIASVNGSGYGHFFARGRDWVAHRYSWVLENGEIPFGQMVLHKCDNRICVNPEHLFLGSALDNARDRDAKGRGIFNGSCRGTSHHKARLTEDQIKDIRRIYSSGGIGQIALAKQFGIAQTTLSGIVRRVTWKHIP